tara:strand:+ start:1530 stop:1748 length:219 start_codon:yes stop_codon:yes gene_type:complete
MSELDKMFEGNPIKKINKICDEMIAFARTAGTVVDCGACNNEGCKACDDTDYDVLADEYNQQQSYESGRVFH